MAAWLVSPSPMITQLTENTSKLGIIQEKNPKSSKNNVKCWDLTKKKEIKKSKRKKVRRVGFELELDLCQKNVGFLSTRTDTTATKWKGRQYQIC